MVDRKLRVLIFNYEYPPLGGGAANATRHILNEFTLIQDIEFVLVTSSTGQFRIEKCGENGEIHFLDIGKKNRNLHYQSNGDLLRYSRNAYRYAKRMIRNQAFDLVHAFFGIPCGYIAMKLGLPYMVSLRGSDVPGYNPRFRLPDKFLFRRLSRKIWRRAAAVIANSAGLKELALKSAPGQGIEVIPNGVDIEFFHPGESARGKRNTPFTIISTGRLIERKGYQYLIPALKDIPGVELLLVGEGNFQHELEQLAVENNVCVRFVGRREPEDVAVLLQQADLFVLPSLNEGMSNSLLEAMASGLPCVVTDVGGSRELVSDNGIIVPAASINNLTEAITVYLSDRKRWIKDGLASRKNAVALEWKIVAASYRFTYFNILQRDLSVLSDS